MITQVGEKCVGCGACVSVCPQKCLSLKENASGFRYPEADVESCIDCGLCDKSCPILKEEKGGAKPLRTLGVRAADENIVLKSSSGGAFYLLSSAVLNNGGCVCGAAIDENNYVYHKVVDNFEALRGLLCSKYVQSDLKNVYSEVKEFLKKGRQVLFSGTPCQVNGLYSFLGKDYDQLLTVDLICHGVPSPYVWKKYVAFMERKYDSKITCVNFRHKENGWERSGLKLDFANGKTYFGAMKDDFFIIQFLQNLCLRESCYSCEFKGMNRAADITIGDFWGVRNSYPELYSDKGVSLLVVNTQKGLRTVEKEPQLCNEPYVDFDKAVQNNSAYSISVEKSRYGKAFVKALEKMPFDKAVNKYVKKLMLKRRLASYLYRIKKIIKK